jgi:hypothetical protein
MTPRPFVLCLRADIATTFTDNEFGICLRCACKVQHRPHVPTPNRLICLQCFHAITAEHDGLVELSVTPETVREVLHELTKQNKN